VKVINQAHLNVAIRRLFFRNGGAAALASAPVVLLAGSEALAQSATMAQANLHDSAPTQFRAVGDARLARGRIDARDIQQTRSS
jgi:hypothetical protein